MRQIDVLGVSVPKFSGDPRFSVLLPDHFHCEISAIPLYHRWVLLSVYPADWTDVALETNVEEP